MVKTKLKDREDKESSRLIVDFPQWMADAIEVAADRLGIAKQAVVKVWVSAKIKEELGESVNTASESVVEEKVKRAFAKHKRVMDELK